MAAVVVSSSSPLLLRLRLACRLVPRLSLIRTSYIGASHTGASHTSRASARRCFSTPPPRKDPPSSAPQPSTTTTNNNNNNNNNDKYNHSHRTRSGSSDTIKFWPFFAIIALGSAGYVLLVNQRAEMASPAPASAPAPASTPTAEHEHELPPPQPAFAPSDVTVIFVLGGPGAGKGTQCARLVDSHGFTHLSAGDLLRAEQDRPGSRYGDLIRSYIKDGLIVPMEVTVALLQSAMADALAAKSSAKGRFLIDGFPRKMDQALKFEQAVCPARLVLFFDCPEHVMQARLLERGKTSGRADDNAESIAKRFRTFVETSMPVVDYYSASDKVLKIDATADADIVSANTQKRLALVLGADF